MTLTYKASRARLLAGTSIAALFMAAGASVAQAQTSVSVEGGIPCPFGDQQKIAGTHVFYYGLYSHATTNKLGTANCGGWTGRVGLMQEKSGTFLGLDYWGIFVRHSEHTSSAFSGSKATTFYGGAYQALLGTDGRYKEDRTVVDFEVGKDIGIGSAANLRAIAGLRYARQSSRTSLGTTTFDSYLGITTSTSVRINNSFEGLGPRLGLVAELPISSGIRLRLGGSGSILWGDHSSSGNVSGSCAPTCTNPTSLALNQSNGSVTNLEGEAAGVFAMPNLNGAELSLGERGETWYQIGGPSQISLQTTAGTALTVSTAVGAAGSLDRNEWGPFLRLKVPLTAP